MWRSCIVSETDELIAAVKTDVKDEKLRAKICMQLRHADSADADIIVLKNRIAKLLERKTNFDRFNTKHEARLAYEQENPLDINPSVPNVGIIIDFVDWLFLHASSCIRMTSTEIRKELANGKGTCCKSQDPAQQA